MDDDMFVMDGEAAPEIETALEEKCTVKAAKAGAGVPKAWVVQNIKSWEMEELATGSLEDCRVALEKVVLESEGPKGKAVKTKKERPFFYVTSKGEQPEMDGEPFTSMSFTAFPAYCDAAAVCSIISLEGLRAIEIRRTKTMPHGYRVRLFHEEGVDVNLNDAVSNLLDLQSLYNMGFDLHPRPNTGGGASIAFTPDESQQMRAGEACVKFVEDATKNLALKLDGEENTELLQKAICFAGERFCSQILERTMEVEANGGMMTRNQERRRTPGGVFFSLLKREISPDLSAFIFGEAPEEKEPGAIAIGGSSISDGMSYTPPASSSLNAHSVEFKAPIEEPQSSSFNPNAVAFTPPVSELTTE